MLCIHFFLTDQGMVEEDLLVGETQDPIPFPIMSSCKTFQLPKDHPRIEVTRRNSLTHHVLWHIRYRMICGDKHQVFTLAELLI